MPIRWFSARSIRLHVTLVSVVSACAALCDWQVHRAVSGNSLSWAYVFEWPFFAGYGVYLWWRLLHEDPAETDVIAPNKIAVTPEQPEVDQALPDTVPHPSEEEELAVYNRYLAQLNAIGRPKGW